MAGIPLLIEGRICEMRGKGRTETWSIKPLRASMADQPMQSLRLSGKVQLVRPQVRQGAGPLRVGDRVVCEGSLRPFSRATNPGQFDYERYQRYLKYIGQMREPGVYPQSRRPFDLMRWLDDLRSYAAVYFTRHLSEVNQPLVMSFLTGETDYLDERELEQIRILGLSHLLAISGLNLGLIILSLRKLMVWVRLPRRLHPICLMSGLWLAVLFVGCQPSALRVGVYLTLVQVGEIWRRPIQPLNLLGATAWIILLANPLSLFLLSFQLSFVVYLAILLLYQPVLHRIERVTPTGSFWIRKLQQSLAVSLAAFMGSAPILLFSFFELPLQGVFMNLWAVPLSEVMIVLIFATLFAGAVFPPIGTVLAWGLDRIVGFFNVLVHGFARLCPWVWTPGRPYISWVLLFYLVCALLLRFFQNREMPGLWRKRERRAIYRAYCLIGVYCLLTLYYPKHTGLEWILLDVGQGDGMFLRLPEGQVVVVDGGGQPMGENYVGEKIVKPFLLSRGIRTIDLLCITHFDTDHVRGLLPLLQEMRVKAIWAPAGSPAENARLIEELAEQRRIPVYHPVRGEGMRWGGVEIEVLNPRGNQFYRKENDRSLTLRLTWSGLRILLTGDLGMTGEEELLAEGLPMEAGILKIGHHGSKYSTSERFLAEVAPKYALISVGSNRYGHPAEETLKRLSREGCTVFRTDEAGAIQIYARKGELRIRVFNNFR